MEGISQAGRRRGGGLGTIEGDILNRRWEFHARQPVAGAAERTPLRYKIPGGEQAVTKRGFQVR
jgi:hypothetical protein